MLKVLRTRRQAGAAVYHSSDVAEQHISELTGSAFFNHYLYNQHLCGALGLWIRKRWRWWESEREREETGGKTWEGKTRREGKTEVEDKGDERQGWIMSRIREE